MTDVFIEALLCCSMDPPWSANAGADRWIEAPIELQTLLPSKYSNWITVEPLGDGGGLLVGLQKGRIFGARRRIDNPHRA